MIGSARILDGLYYFDEGLSFSGKIPQCLNNIRSLSIKENYILASLTRTSEFFFISEYLFLDLFKGIDCSSFNCGSCNLATKKKKKKQRSTYLSKTLQSFQTFLFDS